MWGDLLSLVACPEVTFSTFNDDDELRDWVREKHKHCQDPDKPIREHPTNWLLTEQYFCHDKGREVKAKTKLTEGLERSGNNLSTGLGMLGMEPEGQKQSKSPKERYGLALSKLSQAVGKLGRSIASTELALPPLRKKICEKEFNMLRDGLNAVRQKKEEHMYKLEDFKEMKEDDVEDDILAMVEYQKQVNIDCQTLMEAMAVHQKPVIKHEAPKVPWKWTKKNLALEGLTCFCVYELEAQRCSWGGGSM